tara:strand:- start:1449 stop:1907 length:459 start_codon:yes stop_codon:yes gene_type:complete
MNLRLQIEEKYKDSLKNKKNDVTNVLRLVISAIKDKDIESRTADNKDGINDEKIMILLQTLIKQRKDSIDSFQKAERQDLVENEKNEIEIINQFLPKQLDEKEVSEIISKYIKENNLSSIKEMGKIMGYLKSNHSGSIDMALGGKIAKELLG